MQFLVTFEVDPSYHATEGVQDLRRRATDFFDALTKDSRVSDSGHYADARGGYMVIELNSAAEMAQLTGPWLDMVRFTVHAIMPNTEFVAMMRSLDEQGG